MYVHVFVGTHCMLVCVVTEESKTERLSSYQVIFSTWQYTSRKRDEHTEWDREHMCMFTLKY